ncbi:BON domain protein [Novipirellula aureliae]|uniref:BON domain protein n=1 Tax=Novipirellula aureliae TaxID=2527966 RepID=A0A5C6DLC5_9BACT|nr:BON domain-containing protein [Novipirellula aureliae]TWU35726.1 BON domain protein [Novipirellula aureliae]
MNALLELSRAVDETAIVLNQRSVRIKQAVSAELASTQQGALKGVTCEYEHGMLQLRGNVHSYYLKQLAQEHARRVDGVTHVINSIRVVQNEKPVRPFRANRRI